MKIKNIQDLKAKKTQLKTEISEMESIMSFENPRKTFGVITEGVSEKYLGSFLDSKLAENALPLIGKLLGSTLKVGSAKLFNDIVIKNINKSVMLKGLVGLGILAISPFVLRKIKREVDNYQKNEAAKSLSKLI